MGVGGPRLKPQMLKSKLTSKMRKGLILFMSPKKCPLRMAGIPSKPIYPPPCLVSRALSYTLDRLLVRPSAQQYRLPLSPPPPPLLPHHSCLQPPSSRLTTNSSIESTFPSTICRPFTRSFSSALLPASSSSFAIPAFTCRATNLLLAAPNSTSTNHRSSISAAALRHGSWSRHT